VSAVSPLGMNSGKRKTPRSWADLLLLLLEFVVHHNAESIANCNPFVKKESPTIQ
jgi:hypothetical protein